MAVMTPHGKFSSEWNQSVHRSLWAPPRILRFAIRKYPTAWLKDASRRRRRLSLGTLWPSGDCSKRHRKDAPSFQFSIEGIIHSTDKLSNEWVHTRHSWQYCINTAACTLIALPHLQLHFPAINSALTNSHPHKQKRTYRDVS